MPVLAFVSSIACLEHLGGLLRDLIHFTDHRDPDVLFHQFLKEPFKEDRRQLHQIADFFLPAVSSSPVEKANTSALPLPDRWRPIAMLLHVFHALVMTGRADLALLLRPASVAVHNNRYMSNFFFHTVAPYQRSSLQGELCRYTVIISFSFSAATESTFFIISSVSF